MSEHSVQSSNVEQPGEGPSNGGIARSANSGKINFAEQLGEGPGNGRIAKSATGKQGVKRKTEQKTIETKYEAIVEVEKGLRSKTEIAGTRDSLRTQAADYIRKYPDDFLPFLTKDNSNCYTQDDFAEYCKLLETTPAWGGQLEIQALCKVLRIPVEVVQAEGPSLVTGENYDSKPLVLTYYRHAYSLGEHYRSVERSWKIPTMSSSGFE